MGSPNPIADLAGRLTEQGVIDDILRAMNAYRLKQRDMARELGVSESRVSQMLRAGSNMTLATVERIWAAIERLRASR